MQAHSLVAEPRSHPTCQVPAPSPQKTGRYRESFWLGYWFLAQILGVWDFPTGSVGKESAYNAGDPGSIPGSGRSWRREWQPTPVFLPGESHGQRSWTGYSPWGCRVGHDCATNFHFCNYRPRSTWTQWKLKEARKNSFLENSGEHGLGNTLIGSI